MLEAKSNSAMPLMRRFGAILAAILAATSLQARAAEEKAAKGKNSLQCTAKGKELALPFAYYADNALALRSEDDMTFGMGIEIHLNFEKGVMPEGKRFSRKKQDKMSAGQVGYTTLRLPKPDGKGEEFSNAFDKFDIEIDFGKVAGNRLPGSIRLSIPEKEVELKGAFEAAIHGLRMKNGAPDLASDGFEVLEYAAKLHLEKQLGGIVKITGRGEDLIHWGAKQTESKHPTGRLCVQYLPAGSETPTLRRFKFAKDQEWKVVEELRMDQLFEAHETGPFSQGVPWGRLERELQAQYPSKTLFAWDNNSGRIGDQFLWKVKYQVEGIARDPQAEKSLDQLVFSSLELQKDLKVFEESWLLEKSADAGEYRFVRALAPGEKLEPKSGAASSK